MRRQLWRGAAIFFVFAVLLSCGPKPKQKITTEERCIPIGLSIDSTASTYALIAWNPGCPGLRILRGFNVYVSPKPLAAEYPGSDLPADIRPYNRKVYPGDTLGDPKRESFAVEDLENATQYYVHVRDVYTDGTISPPSNEIPLVVYSQGQFTLRPSFTSDHDGFDFTAGEYCRTDALNNDVYFYSKDGVDYLCSPARLGPVNRETRIFAGGTGASPENWAGMKPNNDFTERARLQKGGVYILITADGYPAKLRVQSITGKGGERQITFDFIYKPPVKKAPSS
jgi:hypothetical protein